MSTKKRFTIISALLFVLLSTLACSLTSTSSEPDAPPTPRPLAGYDFEDVCRRGTIDGVPAYVAEPGSGKVHPVLVFENRFSAENNSFSQIYPSTLKFPVPWMVDYEGDFSTVEVVACLEKEETTFLATCDYQDDESDKVFLLDLYNVNYKVTVYAAQSGEVLANTNIQASVDDCPMFHMFSDDEEKEDYFASVTVSELQDFLAPIVEP